MSLEYLFKLRDEAVKKGISLEDQEKYIYWKQKFEDIDVPFPDSTDWEQIEHMYNTYKMWSLQQEIDELEEEHEELSQEETDD